MSGHEHFEELASIAALGELSPTEAAMLAAHLRSCASCRASYFEFLELVDDHLPLADRLVGRPRVTPGREFRESLLQRVAEEGFRITPEARRGRQAWGRRLAGWLEDLRWGIRARAVPLVLAAALLAMVIVAGWAVRQGVSREREIENLRAGLAQAQANAGQLRSVLSAARQTESHTTATVDKLGQELAAATAEVARLSAQHQQDLATAGSLQARIGQVASESTTFAQEAKSDSEELSSLRGQLARSRAAAADRDVQLLASELRVENLSNQLKGQQAALERERQLLSAGRDIRDVITARNLHIIDVHDMDAHGESPLFGRIFLTEGKRLIFYAYDLDSLRVKNASFQAWGQREDGGQEAVNLGLLYVDDKKQSRWALKVEDPNLLRALNTVFVTIEPRGGAAKPTGKKLMYAYLRNPINHP